MGVNVELEPALRCESLIAAFFRARIWLVTLRMALLMGVELLEGLECLPALR